MSPGCSSRSPAIIRLREICQAIEIIPSRSSPSFVTVSQIHSIPSLTLCKARLLASATVVTMIQARAPRRALQCLPRARPFSTTSIAAAKSPFRQAVQTTSLKNASETGKREQSTAAATSPQRAVPSPAFNRQETRNNVQPLQPFRQPEMDHSFVGMNGGQIFHEMMLRQGVKHVCMFQLSEKLIIEF